MRHRHPEDITVTSARGLLCHVAMATTRRRSDSSPAVDFVTSPSLFFLYLQMQQEIKRYATIRGLVRLKVVSTISETFVVNRQALFRNTKVRVKLICGIIHSCSKSTTVCANEIGHIRSGSFGVLLLSLFKPTEGSKSTKADSRQLKNWRRYQAEETKTRHSSTRDLLRKSLLYTARLDTPTPPYRY